MFEAKLAQASYFKRLAEALKELVSQANFNVGKEGISMHAMDQSHVCLVALNMDSEMFQHYRCDRPMVMGINMVNLLKILKCAGKSPARTPRRRAPLLLLLLRPGQQLMLHDCFRCCLYGVLFLAGSEDTLTLKADDDGDVLTLMFESSKQERASDFELKLLSIDSEQLLIPDQDYAAAVVLPSSEYQRICRCAHNVRARARSPQPPAAA